MKFYSSLKTNTEKLLEKELRFQRKIISTKLSAQNYQHKIISTKLSTQNPILKRVLKIVLKHPTLLLLRLLVKGSWCASVPFADGLLGLFGPKSRWGCKRAPDSHKGVIRFLAYSNLAKIRRYSS